MLFRSQKLDKIVELLSQQPYWTSAELARELGISRSTVQNCLQELHDARLVERIHGGVRCITHTISAPVSVNQRLGKDQEAKVMICDKALRLVPQQGYIYIDAGTTTLPLAERLAGGEANKNLMCVTNDVAIALVLAKMNIRHALLGGQLHPVTQSISGSMSQQQLAGYRFDACFLSVDSISADGTVSSALAEESDLKRQALRQSRHKVLLAASSKFVQRSGAVIGGLKNFDALIMEKSVKEIVTLCKRHKVEFISAGHSSIRRQKNKI